MPALLQAVVEHADGYVRYRALVLLTGFNDPRTRDAMRESMTSPNDRLRTVAYSFFEHNPEPALVPDLIASLDEVYQRVIAWALGHRAALVGGVLAVGLSAVALLPFIGTEFFPASDESQFILRLRAPVGTRVEETERVVARMEDIIRTTLGTELLRPTRIYVRPILDLLRRHPHGTVRAMAHITGGGLPGNLPRVLPADCRAVVRRGSWRVPPVFRLIERLGRVPRAEMDRTFNTGIGFVLVVARARAARVLEDLRRQPARGVHPGEVPGGVDADAVLVQAAGKESVQGRLSGGHVPDVARHPRLCKHRQPHRRRCPPASGLRL